jgi:hypothetical protein
MSIIQEQEQHHQYQYEADIDMLETKFISKVSLMGPNRYFVHFPTEHEKVAKSLKGKYVRAHIYEIVINGGSSNTGSKTENKIDLGSIQSKFISKITTMGANRYFIQFPKEQLKNAKVLRGKYLWVSIQEIPVEGNSNNNNNNNDQEGAAS